MFMRYYPKEIKPVNRMEMPTSDRGKKHYWGHELGNYGFYESEHLKELARANKSRNGYGHRRVHTTALDETKREYTQPKTPHNNDQKNPRDRNLLSVSRKIDIHLPSIPKISRQSQTQDYKHANPQNEFRYHSIPHQPQNTFQAKDQTQQKSFLNLRKTGRRNRLSTDPSTHHFSNRKKYESIMDGQEHNVRYSPTFVCSIQNPMPTFKLYPSGLNYDRSLRRL